MTHKEPMFQKARKSRCPSSKVVRQKELSLTQGWADGDDWKEVDSVFVLFKLSADWMKPTHIREGTLHYVLYQ